VRLSGRDQRFSIENWIGSLLRIYDDVRTKGLSKRAVGLMAWNFEIDQESVGFFSECSDVWIELFG